MLGGGGPMRSRIRAGVAPLAAVARGETIRAMLVRMAVVGFALVAVLAAVRVLGNRVATQEYRQAAVVEAGRIDSAGRLLVSVVNAQTSLQGYVGTIEPTFTQGFSDATGRFFTDYETALAVDADAPEVLGALERLYLKVLQWQGAAGAALAAMGRLDVVRARRLTRAAAGRLTGVEAEHAALMHLLERRRLDAVAEADRWGRLAFWVSNGVIAIGGLVIALFALRIVRRVLGPLGALQTATARVAQGLPGEPVPVHPEKDEIHDLAVAFNAMELDLAAARRQLEARAAQLEEADRVKGEFVANVSHELRTPLTAIIGYAQLLMDVEEGALAPEQRADLTTILTSAEHLLLLINDLLDVARMDAGRLEVAPERCDGRDLARGACQAVATLAHAKGLTLVQRLSEEPVPVFCDPARARQVLLNLLGNAVKFTDRGSVTLTCERSGPWCLLSVSDTGAGIPEGDTAAIWQEFRQVDGSITRRRGGTGLGLAITRHLVALQAGTVTCESDAGVGSTFTVALPAEAPPEGAAPPAAPAPLGAAVLVVGERERAELIARWARGAGYVPRVAIDAEAALASADEGAPPAFVVVDPTLHGVEGSALLARACARAAGSPPALVLALLDSRGRGAALAGVEHLVKPLDRARLLDAVERRAPELGERGSLVVEADPAARELAARCLSPLGPIHAVADPREGLSALRALRPALAVVDLAAGAPALELIRVARLDPDLADVAIVTTCPAHLPAARADEVRRAAIAMTAVAGPAREALLAALGRLPVGAPGSGPTARTLAGLAGRPR
jgi:signal transduction histidine kinase/CheY-like chemotaxis protein